MNQVGPWSVKGIDQRARDAARDAAKEQGVTLGEYLNNLLIDEAERPTDDVAQPYQRDIPRPEAATRSLDSLTRRIEAAEARSTLAITGIDQSVIGLLARLEQSEDSTAAVAAHVDTVLDDIRSTHDGLQEKVRTMEADDTTQRNMEALKALEDALGKLASHVYEESALAQDESTAVKARVEIGFNDVNERLDGMEGKVEQTLTDAARRVEKAVEDAELRAEGTARHLSDRFTALETDVASKLATMDPGRLDAMDERVNEMSGDVAGALDSMENTLTRIQERLNRAENTTDAALKSLESTFEVLDRRIDDVAAGADPEAAEELRRQFEARFDGLAEEVRNSVAATRAELAEEIEKAARTVDPEFIGDVQTALTSVEERLEAVEQRDPSESAEAVRAEFARLSEVVDARLEQIEDREASAIETVGEEISRMTETLHQQVADSEQRSADAIEQVGTQVATVGQRLEARQDEANRLLSEKVDQAASRQDSRLSEALSNVSQRLELMQEQTSSTLSPVQKAIASLATRLESLEDFTTPPFAEPAAKADPIPAIPDLPTSEPLFEPATEASAIAPETPEPAPEVTGNPLDELAKIAPPSEQQAAEEPETFEAGIEGWDVATPSAYGEDFGTTPAAKNSTPEYIADLPTAEELSGEADPLGDLGNWEDDAVVETRESDIFETATDTPSEDDVAAVFDTPAEDAATGETASDDPETGDYLARARAAAQAAAADSTSEADAKKGKKRAKSAKAPKGAKAEKAAKPAKDQGEKSGSNGSGRVPLYAGAAVVAIAAAGSTYYLNLRGKQAAPAPVVTAQPAAIAATPAERAETAAATEDPVTVADASPTAATVATAESSGEPTLDAAPDAPDAVAADFVDPDAPLDEGSALPAADIASLAPIPALSTLEQASENGSSAARYVLGVQRLEDENFSLGAQLIRAAANDGQPAAQYRLAKLHEKGLGVPRDLAAAREWTERSASAGNVKAMHDLAVFYAEGEGGPQSYAGAVEWFRKASEYGVVDSQYNLGVLYEEGLGISPNLVEALTWYEIARREGDPGAEAKIIDLKDRVSVEAAAEAARRAAEWVPTTNDPAANGEFADSAWAAGTPHILGVQQALASLGYDVGAADGTFGPATIDAIRSYQIEQGLETTGTIDQTLVDSLNALIGTGAARGQR